MLKKSNNNFPSKVIKGNEDSFISIQLCKALKTIKSGTTNMTLINIFETKYKNVLSNLDKLFTGILETLLSYSSMKRWSV